MWQEKQLSLQFEKYNTQDQKLLIRGKQFSAMPIMSNKGIYDVYLMYVNDERFQEFITNTVWRKCLTGENFDKFNESKLHRQNFSYQYFTFQFKRLYL